MNFIDTKSLERALDVYGAITNHEHVAPLMSPSDLFLICFLYSFRLKLAER